MRRRKCYGEPTWNPPGVQIDSWVDARDCSLDTANPAYHILRVKNFSLFVWEVSADSQIAESALQYTVLRTPRRWAESFEVPARDSWPRTSTRQEEIGSNVKATGSRQPDQNIWIECALRDADTGVTYQADRFALQLDALP